MPFYLSFLFGEGFPTKIDNREKKGTLILFSLLEDLDYLQGNIWNTLDIVLQHIYIYTLVHFAKGC